MKLWKKCKKVLWSQGKVIINCKAEEGLCYRHLLIDTVV
jgi:hypothetical protein